MQNTHNVQDNDELFLCAIHIQFTVRIEKWIKQKRQSKNEKGTGPCEQTDTHVQF
jgi:hypothetical protein